MIVCAMNLTKDNTGYFSYARLSKARPGVIFINVARGEFSPVKDLLCLCEEGGLGGVGLDVYNNESALGVALRAGKANRKAKTLLRLREKHNVVLTPHNAFNTVESVNRKAEQSARQVESFLKTGKFLWPVLEN
jgi:D-lactate dehydrogenase